MIDLQRDYSYIPEISICQPLQAASAVLLALSQISAANPRQETGAGEGIAFTMASRSPEAWSEDCPLGANPALMLGKIVAFDCRAASLSTAAFCEASSAPGEPGLMLVVMIWLHCLRGMVVPIVAADVWIRIVVEQRRHRP